MLNLGCLQVGGAGVSARIYYDIASWPVGDLQGLRDRPRGYCLDVSNQTGVACRLTILGAQINPPDVRGNRGEG